jgi:hypothetical protein
MLRYTYRSAKKGIAMKHASTLLLRGSVLLMGAAALAICIFALPAGIASNKVGYYFPILLGLYVPVVPFLFALYQTLRLLEYIDKNIAFSDLSVRALKKIKYCAIFIGVLFTAGLPYIYLAAQSDDAPGVFAMGLIIVFASYSIAVFAAVLQRLLQSAIAIKSENDLTV